MPAQCSFQPDSSDVNLGQKSRSQTFVMSGTGPANAGNLGDESKPHRNWQRAFIKPEVLSHFTCDTTLPSSLALTFAFAATSAVRPRSRTGRRKVNRAEDAGGAWQRKDGVLAHPKFPVFWQHWRWGWERKAAKRKAIPEEGHPRGRCVMPPSASRAGRREREPACTRSENSALPFPDGCRLVLSDKDYFFLQFSSKTREELPFGRLKRRDCLLAFTPIRIPGRVTVEKSLYSYRC